MEYEMYAAVLPVEGFAIRETFSSHGLVAWYANEEEDLPDAQRPTAPLFSAALSGVVCVSTGTAPVLVAVPEQQVPIYGSLGGKNSSHMPTTLLRPRSCAGRKLT